MALFCRSHQKFQPFADLPLPGELAEHWRSQRDFEGSIGFRRFHGPVRGNLITSNQKLRTTGFVVWQSSLESAGCQPAIVGSLPTRFCFRVAHASRMLAMTSRHRGLDGRLRTSPHAKAQLCKAFSPLLTMRGTRPRQWILGRMFRRDAESPRRTGVTRETRALPGINVIARFIASRCNHLSQYQFVIAEPEYI